MLSTPSLYVSRAVSVAAADPYLPVYNLDRTDYASLRKLRIFSIWWIDMKVRIRYIFSSALSGAKNFN